jgi:hypothetical protein
MTQPAEAVGGEANTPAAETPQEYFEQMAADEFGIQEEEEPTDPEAEQPEAEAEDETDIEEEADDLPPIDAPVSWDAEAKEKFAELPRDVQEYVAKREGERERFVQSKSQEAARAKQEAVQQATSELAQIEQAYAQHFQQLAENLQPQRPNPALLQHDPAAFYAQQAAYEDAVAQQRQLQQRSSEYAQQAQARQQQIEQAELAEQHRIIVEQFPEYADPTMGPKLQQELSGIARELGYPPELIAQARAADIIAMKKVSDLKAKADKYDALMSKKMEKVRAAKGLPRVAKPGVAQGGDQLRARSAQAAIETARTAKNRDVQGAAFFDYLKNTGQL